MRVLEGLKQREQLVVSVISSVEVDRCPYKIQTNSNNKGDQGLDRKMVSWQGNPHALALGLSQEVVTEEELDERENAIFHLIMSRRKDKKKNEEAKCDDGKKGNNQGACQTKAGNAEAKEEEEEKDLEKLPEKSERKLDSEDEEASIYDLYPCEEEEETPELTFMIGVESSSSIERRFLKFYQTDIREEKLNGETIESWNRINLRGFDVIKEDPPNVTVQLKYSTEYINNRHKLDYIIEQSSCKALKAAVDEVFDFQAKVAAGREAMSTKTLKCIKCSNIFKHNFVKNGLKNITCQECGSYMLNEYQEPILMPDQNESKYLESASSVNEEVLTNNICNSSTPSKPKDSDSGSMAESTITPQEALKTSFSSKPDQAEDESEPEVAVDVLTLLASGGTEGESSPQTDDGSSYEFSHSDFTSMSANIPIIAPSLEANEPSGKAFKFGLKYVDKVLKAFKPKSIDASVFGVVQGMVMSKAEQTVEYWSLQEPVLEWNYKDFAQIDHRIHLYCELNLTEKEDDCVLLLTKVDLILSSKPNKLIPGVVVMTLNKFHFLRIMRPETENPDEWLELVHSVKIQTLSQITRSFGVQSLSFEFQDPSEDFRAHLLFRESQHCTTFEEFFLKKFRKYIKINATIRFVSEEEDKTKILDHFLDHGIQKNCHFFAAIFNHKAPQLFHMLRIPSLRSKFKTSGSIPERICIIIDENSLFLSSDISNWIMNKSSYAIEGTIAHSKIQQIELFDDQPLKLDIKTAKTRLELGFISEASIRAFLVQLKDIWTAIGSFEDILVIHFVKQNESVSLQHLCLEDSSYPTPSEMPDWINVMKQTLAKK